MCLTAGREASDGYKSPELNQQPKESCEELSLNSLYTVLLFKLIQATGSQLLCMFFIWQEYMPQK